MKGFDFEAFLDNVVENYNEGYNESDYELNFGDGWRDILFDGFMPMQEKKAAYIAAQKAKSEVRGHSDITIRARDPWLIELWGNETVKMANDFANNPDMTNPDAMIQNTLNSLIIARENGDTAQVNAFNAILRSYISAGYDVYSLMSSMDAKADQMASAMKSGAQATPADVAELTALRKAVGYMDSAERVASPYRTLFNNAERLGALRGRLQVLDALQGNTTPEQDAEMDKLQEEIFAVESTLKTEMQGYDLSYLQSVVGNKKKHLYLTNDGKNGAIDKTSIDSDMFNGLGRLGMLISFEMKKQAPIAQTEGM